MEEHKAKEIKSAKEFQGDQEHLSLDLSTTKLHGYRSTTNCFSRSSYLCLLILDQSFVDGSLIMHEMRVLDLGNGLLAFWVFDPCIKRVQSLKKPI